jgi:hypothetical protein
MRHARKFVVALAGAAAVAVSVGVVPEAVEPYITVALAFLTSLGVYVAPNEP